tara:strand:+ start:1004 stop:1504 length:501 start_codon:yes stop_codon:yes gene_type:complete
MFQEMTDIGMSWEGDLLFDDSGDPVIVFGDDWVLREINKRVRTTNPDWSSHPNVGADIEEFVGRPNTQSIGKQIEFSIVKALTVDSFLQPAKIKVETVPTTLTSIAVLINVVLASQERLVTQVIFDVKNGIKEVISEARDMKPLGRQHDPVHHTVTDNKYMLRRGL